MKIYFAGIQGNVSVYRGGGDATTYIEPRHLRDNFPRYIRADYCTIYHVRKEAWRAAMEYIPCRRAWTSREGVVSLADIADKVEVRTTED